MRTIDGSGGGGQILRSALTLAAIHGEPVRLEDIRGGRDPPGLRPQHLAGVALLATLVDAEVAGDEIGATDLTFTPTEPPTGAVELDIGTAGSITLLFDTVVPLGPVLDDPITVTVEGGTDVKWSPTMDYLDRVKRPALATAGFDLDLDVERRGYYPIGGGRATLKVHPADPVPFDLAEPGDLAGATITAHASESLRRADVAERQATAMAETLETAAIPVEDTGGRDHDVPSTGTSATAVGRFTAGFGGGDALGERGKPAEDVGREAADALLEAADAQGSVDRYLADQLLVPLALAGGTIRIPALTDHVETNREVIEAFAHEVAVEPTDAGVLLSA